MLIEVNSIEEFCSELKAEHANGGVVGNLVRLRIDRSPQQKEGITFDIGIWATAVVKVDAETYAILQFGAVTGEDTRKAKEGSEIAEAWHAVVSKLANEIGLEVRHGRVELL